MLKGRISPSKLWSSHLTSRPAHLPWLTLEGIIQSCVQWKISKRRPVLVTYLKALTFGHMINSKGEDYLIWTLILPSDFQSCSPTMVDSRGSYSIKCAWKIPSAFQCLPHIWGLWALVTWSVLKVRISQSEPWSFHLTFRPAHLPQLTLEGLIQSSVQWKNSKCRPMLATYPKALTFGHMISAKI